MKHNKKLIILVGNIGSGKSTLAKKYVKKGYVVIARDALRYNIGGGEYIFDPKLEPAIWGTELAMIVNFMEINANIIIDEVGLTRSLREQYINLAYKYNYHITALILPKLSMKKSVDRRLQNPHGKSDRKLWEGIWKNFDEAWEAPNYEEGFDIIWTKCLYTKRNKNEIRDMVENELLELSKIMDISKSMWKFGKLKYHTIKGVKK